MHGVYLLWWVQEKDISPAVVATILAAGDLALIGLELPTGWLADRFGHRASLIVGSLVQVLGMVWCWLGEGVPGLLTASVLVALGDAFRSGADQALLYRTCLALDREQDFQKIEARTEAIALVALVVLVLLGGIIVHHGGFVLGWIAETMLCACGLVIACAMAEPARRPGSSIAEEITVDRTPIAHRKLAAVIVPTALLGGAASATAFLAQIVPGNGPARVTVLVAVLTAAEAGGSWFASRLPHVTPRAQLLLAGFGWILLLLAAITPTMSIVAVVLSFLAGVAQPLRAAALQQLAPDDARARVASAASACDMIISAVLLPLATISRH